MAKPNLERFYSLKDLSRRIGRNYVNDFGKEMRRENPYGVDTYRWAVGQGSKVWIKQSDANIILEAHGVAPITMDPPQRNDYYGPYQVAEILGVNHQTVYNLAMNTNTNDACIPMTHIGETRFTTKKLAEWFGMGTLKRSGLHDRHIHSLAEVSKALRVSQKRIMELVESGDLEPVNRESHLSQRLSISHDDLYDWIESRKGAFDADKMGNKPRETVEVAS